MRIFIWNYNFVGLSKKFVYVVNFELVYSTVRFAALKGAPEEAEIMQIFIRNYDFFIFQKYAKKVPVRCYPR